MKRCSRLAVGIGLVLLTGAAAAGPLAAQPQTQPLTPETRLAIVRALAFEYATAKQPLPASQKVEEALEVASPGVVKEEKLRQHLAKRGAAVQPGDIVQITGLEFKSRSILFEINGGGRKRKKWYQRIQIQGSGGPISGNPVPTTPAPGGLAPPPGTGSWILLTFADRLPDVPPEEIKKMLAGVLDFAQHSATTPWIETIPEEFREAIKDKKAKVGMNREMVLAALGRPDRKVRETHEGRESEDWIYGNPPFVTFVTFVGDAVVEVKEFR